MSAYEVISLSVWIVSSIAVVYSLYQVNRQTRIFSQQTDYVARSLVESRTQSLNEQSHEMSRIFVQYPELRPYFYYSQPIDEKHPDFHRAEAVAELLLDILYAMSNEAAQAQPGEHADMERNKALWYDFVEDSFVQSPILVQTLLRRQDWYGEEMVEQMKAGLARHASGPHAEHHH